MKLRADQIRAARGLLDWSQNDLAERTRLSVRTIKRAEKGEAVTPAADLSIRNALEVEGVAFFSNGDDLAAQQVVAGVAIVRK